MEYITQKGRISKLCNLTELYEACVCAYSCRSVSASDHAEALSLASLTAKVEEWLPDAAGAGEDGTFPEAVAEQIRPAAIAQFEEAQAAIFLAGAEVQAIGNLLVLLHL